MTSSITLAPSPSLNPSLPQAKLPGLATTIELLHALRRLGVHLGLAGGSMLSSPPLLWHAANLLSDAPLR